jgi:DNA-binding response OmpR family regulator
MHKVLFISPDTTDGPTDTLVAALRSSRFTVGRLPLGRDAAAVEALCAAFDGRPPDILVADLTESASGLPLRHAMRLLTRTWGDDMPSPVRLALLTRPHLDESGWLADADEFLLPPFDPRELLARLELQLFRKRHAQALDRITLDDIVIELGGGRVFDLEGRQILLTPREFDLLKFLATQRGKFFARDRLLDLVWGLDFEGGERTVDIHIRRLRAKLPPGAEARLETRRGVGYGFVSG